MNLVFFLKTLCDLCYYAVYACFFGSVYGLESTLLPQLALFSAIGALTRFLWAKRPFGPLRFAPLVLLPPIFLLPTQTAGLVVLAPAALYVVWCTWKCTYDPGYSPAADAFLLELKLLPLPFIFATAMLQMARMETYSMPYLLVFLLASVLLLRMVRHDEDTLSQPRFRLMNGLSMGGLLAVCGFLSSPLFRKVIAAGAKLLWSIFATPVLLLFSGIGMGIGWLIETLVPDTSDLEFINPDELIFEIVDAEERQPGITDGATAPDPIISYLISALLVALAIALIVLLFRWLSSNNRRGTTAAGVQTRSDAVPLPPQEKPLTRLTARTPAQKVRYWYQQLLRKTADEGGNLKSSMTTLRQQEVENAALPDNEPSIARLRELYLPARYADRAGDAAAREAKALYQQIKKN